MRPPRPSRKPRRRPTPGMTGNACSLRLISALLGMLCKSGAGSATLSPAPSSSRKPSPGSTPLPPREAASLSGGALRLAASGRRPVPFRQHIAEEPPLLDGVVQGDVSVAGFGEPAAGDVGVGRIAGGGG